MIYGNIVVLLPFAGVSNANDYGFSACQRRACYRGGWTLVVPLQEKLQRGSKQVLLSWSSGFATGSHTFSVHSGIVVISLMLLLHAGRAMRNLTSWVLIILICGSFGWLIFSSSYIRVAICIFLVVAATVDIVGDKKLLSGFGIFLRKIFDAVTSLG